jgi:hypothetical protein
MRGEAVSSPQPPLPGGAPQSAGPATREIPVVPPTATGATAAGAPADRQSAAAALSPHPTGPVDYVPGPPPPGGPATAPAPAVASVPSHEDFLGDHLEDSPRRTRGPLAVRRLAATVLAIAALAVLELGLLVHEAGRNLWADVPLWSGFATLAALLGLAALAAGLPARRSVPAAAAWPAAAAGLVGLAVFWLLVVLPRADTDRGFLLTAALGCLGGGVWLAVERRSEATTAPAAGSREEPAQSS